MESSREGLVKKLNGHGNGVNGQGGGKAEGGAPQQQPSELVDELAQAMNMGRVNMERPQSAPPPPPSANPGESALPAMAAPRSLFDDEEDDVAMPIPSTWRTPPEPPKSGTLRDQLRAAGLGFATGLAVIVPVVLVMTGRLGDVSLDALIGAGEPPAERASTTPAAPAKSAAQVQQRTVSTMIVPPGPVQSKTEAPQISRIANTPDPAPPATETTISEPKASWTSAVAEGKKRILDGDVLGGREVLMPAVEADEPEALMALAETYDPNMLAAWGVRDVASDVAQAKELYERAMRAGVEPAKARLEGLN